MLHPLLSQWICGSFWGGVALFGTQLLSIPLRVGAEALRQPQAPRAEFQRADFGQENASTHAREVSDWILNSQDHQGMPFVVVDKTSARVFVFNRQGRLLGAAAALVGLTRGDEGVPGIGDRPLRLIRPAERTTPSGRFTASLAQNVWGQAILWVDYEQGISLHPVRSVDPLERRLERLASPSVEDNRISYGCINVPHAFWTELVQPQFQSTMGVVYVLPDTKPLKDVFKMTPIIPSTP
jgi:hypothetical protein